MFVKAQRKITLRVLFWLKSKIQRSNFTPELCSRNASSWMLVYHSYMYTCSFCLIFKFSFVRKKNYIRVKKCTVNMSINKRQWWVDYNFSTWYLTKLLRSTNWVMFYFQISNDIWPAKVWQESIRCNCRSGWLLSIGKAVVANYVIKNSCYLH